MMLCFICFEHTSSNPVLEKLGAKLLEHAAIYVFSHVPDLLSNFHEYWQNNMQNNNWTNAVAVPMFHKYVNDEINEKIQYNAILSISNIDQLLTSAGWTVYADEELLQEDNDDTMVVAGVYGFVNTGKTFVIGRLCGISAAGSRTKRTVGISIKICEDICYLDTAGIRAAVPAMNATMMYERGVFDSFQQELLLHITEVGLYIMGQTSLLDQMYLTFLTKMFERKVGSDRKMLVLHNHQHVNYEDINKTIQDDILSRFGNIRRQTIPSCQFFVSKKYKHFLLVNDTSEGGQGWNNNTFECIKNNFQDVRRNKILRRKVIPKIMATAQNILRSYLKNISEPSISEPKKHFHETNENSYFGKAIQSFISVVWGKNSAPEVKVGASVNIEFNVTNMTKPSEEKHRSGETQYILQKYQLENKGQLSLLQNLQFSENGLVRDYSAFFLPEADVLYETGKLKYILPLGGLLENTLQCEFRSGSGGKNFLVVSGERSVPFTNFTSLGAQGARFRENLFSVEHEIRIPITKASKKNVQDDCLRYYNSGVLILTFNERRRKGKSEL